MLEKTSHGYTIRETINGRFRVMMILSEHDTQREAVYSMLKAMKEESSKNIKREIEELKPSGIEAETFEDAVKDLDGGKFERFLKERDEKFIRRFLRDIGV